MRAGNTTAVLLCFRELSRKYKNIKIQKNIGLLFWCEELRDSFSKFESKQIRLKVALSEDGNFIVLPR